MKKNYIGETKRNFQIRKSEHEDIVHGNSEPAKHLGEFSNYEFKWEIITQASGYTRSRKNLEAFYIAQERPYLNEQVNLRVLSLFRHGIT